MPDVVPTHRLTHEASQKMIAAGVKKANELSCKVSLAVVDQSCRMIAFLMMDGARHFSIITTQRKAITSPSTSIGKPPGTLVKSPIRTAIESAFSSGA